MIDQALTLYLQAVAYAYETAGGDINKGTIRETLIVGKYTELIVRECARISDEPSGRQPGYNIKKHFGLSDAN
jgi:hypothetical protein